MGNFNFVAVLLKDGPVHVDEIDIVNNSVYCFYWNPGNVAYTLANIDMNIKMTGNKKPVRPYYWTLLHGGGGGWRWWKNQPIADEEKRAMIASVPRRS